MGFLSRVYSSWFEPRCYLQVCMIANDQRVLVIGLFGQKKNETTLNIFRNAWQQLVLFLSSIDVSPENIRELHLNPEMLLDVLDLATWTQKPEVHLINLDSGRDQVAFIKLINGM